MTNEELKKKIVEIIQSVDFYDGLLYRYCIDIATADKLADALIAARIGDMSKQRLLVGKDGTVKQFYSGEEVEKIVNERDEYKHRAEVAERALSWLCDETMRDIRIIMYPTTGKQVRDKQELYDYCIEQAKCEIEEEERK